MDAVLILAQIVLIVLKCLGYISCGWVMVFIPIYILVGLTIVGLILGIGWIAFVKKFLS